MSARLASQVLVSALIRKVEADAGTGMVLAKGDATAGALLLLLCERGRAVAMRERGLRPNGELGWIDTGPSDLGDPIAISDYVARRRRSDPDLWVVELDGLDIDRVEELLELV